MGVRFHFTGSYLVLHKGFELGTSKDLHMSILEKEVSICP
jgi:hypothetical protein